jgi:hypothetical protein
MIHVRPRSMSILVVAVLAASGAAWAQTSPNGIPQTELSPPPLPPPLPPPAPTDSESLPWYQPQPNEAFRPPDESVDRVDQEKRRGYSAGIIVEPGFSVLGDGGATFAVMARFFGTAAGMDIGYINTPVFPYSPFGSSTPLGAYGSQSRFIVGVSFIHKAIALFAAGRHHLYFVLPEIDLRFTASQYNFSLMAGGTLLGIRYSVCLGPISLFALLGGPTLFGILEIPALQLGATLGFNGTLGIGF